MPIEIVEISDSRVAVQLERIGPNARAALEEALAPLATQIGADARSRAAAHIHLIGKESLGAYVESIKDGVASKDARVVGWVRSNTPTIHFKGRDVPLAVLMQYGANPPPHEILPDVATALNFEGSAGEVFAAKVSHPGAHIAAFPDITVAFESAAPEIRATLEEAVKGAARK